MGASSTEIRARLEATRQRLDGNLDQLLKELAPNEVVARYLRRPVTLTLVGAGIVLALVLPKTPPERLLGRKRRKAAESPQSEQESAVRRALPLLEALPPRALRALADAGVASILAKRWLDRNAPSWLSQHLSKASGDGRHLPAWLERRLPRQLGLNGHAKRHGVLRFLP
ncbi:MAG: hypothetical protein ACXVZO_01970 [Gaiellaceae bacterium]